MNITIRSYITGFILSLLFTLAAFLVAIDPGFFHMESGAIIPVIVALAICQLVVQLICFMHLGDSAHRMDSVVFASTVGIILVIVIGSFWIMDHLNYNMMASPQLMEAYVQSQDGL